MSFTEWRQILTAYIVIALLAIGSGTTLYFMGHTVCSIVK